MSKVTTEKYKATVDELTNGEYEMLGQYVNSKVKTLLRHKTCGNVFSMAPNKFSFGQRCPKCMRPNHNRSNDHFIEEVNAIVGDEYSPIEEYKGVTTKILFKHNTCGNEYLVTPHKFINGGRRCPKCFGSHRKTTEQFSKEVSRLTNGEYILTSEYTNSKTHTSIRHIKCGEEWHIKPSNFLSGRRCPNCRLSRGEEAVRLYLEKENIFYHTQFTFDECRNVHPLPFDFIVFLEGGNFILIEYQGEQHYKPVSAFGGEKAFKAQQKRDEIKRDFCKTHDITLVEIPYTNLKNISEYLPEVLRPYEGLFIMEKSS